MPVSCGVDARVSLMHSVVKTVVKTEVKTVWCGRTCVGDALSNPLFLCVSPCAWCVCTRAVCVCERGVCAGDSGSVRYSSCVSKETYCGAPVCQKRPTLVSQETYYFETQECALRRSSCVCVCVCVFLCVCVCVCVCTLRSSSSQSTLSRAQPIHTHTEEPSKTAKRV